MIATSFKLHAAVLRLRRRLRLLRLKLGRVDRGHRDARGRVDCWQWHPDDVWLGLRLRRDLRQVGGGEGSVALSGQLVNAVRRVNDRLHGGAHGGSGHADGDLK